MSLSLSLSLFSAHHLVSSGVQFLVTPRVFDEPCLHWIFICLYDIRCWRGPLASPAILAAELERRSPTSRTTIPKSDRIGLIRFQKWLSLLLLLCLVLQSLLEPSPLTSKVFLEELCLLSHFKHLDAMLMQFAPKRKASDVCATAVHDFGGDQTYYLVMEL